MQSFRRSIKDTAQYIRYEIRGARLAAALLLAGLFLLVIGLAPNYSVMGYALGSGDPAFMITVLSGLILGIFTAAEWHMTVLIVLVALLSGINIVLLLGRVKRLRNAGATGAGSLLGLAFAGCPSCATGLLPLLGLSAGIGFLPFRGAELTVVSVVLLLLALHWNAGAESCRV